MNLTFDIYAGKDEKPIGRGSENDKQSLVNKALEKGIITEADAGTVTCRLVKTDVTKKS